MIHLIIIRQSKLKINFNKRRFDYSDSFLYIIKLSIPFNNIYEYHKIVFFKRNQNIDFLSLIMILYKLNLFNQIII